MRDDQEVVTTTEAAAELGITRETLTQQIAAGRLPAARFGRLWAIRRGDLDAYRRRTAGRKGKPGPKPKHGERP